MDNKALGHLYSVVWSTRNLVQTLTNIGNEISRQYGINAGQRTVLELLSVNEPQTVPQMAKTKAVSRQYVQLIVNSLLEQQLVESLDNPAHQRSPLLQRTPRGSEIFAQIREQENAMLSQIAPGFPSQDLKTTGRTLNQLRDFLSAKHRKP